MKSLIQNNRFFREAGRTCRRLGYVISLVARACPGLMAAIAVCNLLLGIMPVINSVTTANILNDVAGANMTGILNQLLIKAVVLFTTSTVNYGNGTLLSLAGARTSDFIRKEIIAKAEEIDMADYDLPSFYSKLENAKKEAGTRPISIISAMFGLFSTVITITSYIVILSGFSLGITAVVILVGIPRCIFTHIYRRKNYQYQLSSTSVRRQMGYYNNLVTSPQAVKELKIYRLFGWVGDKYSQSFKRYYSGLKDIAAEEFRWEILLSFMTTVITAGIYLFTAIKAVAGEINIGEFSLYAGALTTIASSMLTLASQAAAIYSGTLFIDNLYEFLNRERKIRSPENPRKLSFHVQHTICFDHVSFSYPGCEREVLKDISFTVQTGEKLVIIGLNGSGKTTLIKLIMRLYDPTSGAIYLDGTDLRQYSVDELTRLYSVIFQDYNRYAETVEQNIAPGCEENQPDMSEIETAAARGQADSFIRGMDDGYQTPLSRLFYDNGTELSTGQWQRVALSRAFYRKADIYIFDEPTAALDGLSEQAVMEQLMEDDPTAIKILITHRLLFSERASRIMVLENGRIKEMRSQGSMADE